MDRLTDRPDMTLDDYRGRKTTIQQQQQQHCYFVVCKYNRTFYFFLCFYIALGMPVVLLSVPICTDGELYLDIC